MIMLTAISSFLGNPKSKLRRPGAGEEKCLKGARSAFELGAHELYRFRGLEYMLWIATRLHAFSPGVAETGEKEATPAAVADLCFCQGKCTWTQHPKEVAFQKQKMAFLTNLKIPWHYRYKLDGVSVNYDQQSDGVSAIL
jgi:hypothetical protein